MSFDVSGAPPLPGPVFFDRRELPQILSVYGRLVAAAEARDYALSDGREAAEFAVFRRTGDAPAYRIEKRPALHPQTTPAFRTAGTPAARPPPLFRSPHPRTKKGQARKPAL